VAGKTSSASKAGAQAAAPRKSTGKAAPRRRSSGKKGAITPEQALANTRKLLEAKQEHDRQVQPWQQLDGGHAPALSTGQESAEAAAKAEQLHAAESRVQAIQGSNSTQDRHNQGKRDNR